LAKLKSEVTASGLRPAPVVVTVTAEDDGPTEAEKDAVLVTEWRDLPVSEIRSRCRNTEYKKRFDRLMAENRI